jgi:hypothetical protein
MWKYFYYCCVYSCISFNLTMLICFSLNQDKSIKNRQHPQDEKIKYLFMSKYK